MADQIPKADLSELLAINEESISQHYKIYSERFREYKNFWLDLSSQEQNHAQWIRDLAGQAKKGLVIINEKRFDKESVLEFQKHLKGMLAYIRENDVSIKQALEDGLSIEKFLLEKNFFEVFETEVTELKATISRINEDVKKHRADLERLLRGLSKEGAGNAK
jgi:rubrerythrin